MEGEGGMDGSWEGGAYGGGCAGGRRGVGMEGVLVNARARGGCATHKCVNTGSWIWVSASDVMSWQKKDRWQ